MLWDAVLKIYYGTALVLHALDDPFMNQAVIPGAQALSPSVAYEYSPRGGHVGFAQGKPWSTSTWLGTRLVAFITEQLASEQNMNEHSGVTK